MKNAKYFLLSIFIFSIASGTVLAQAFADGANVISIGFGIPPGQRLKNDFNNVYKNYIDYKFKNYGTGELKYEHGLHKYFGLGLNFEYSGASASYKYDDANTLRYERKININVFGVYARFNGHFPIMEKLDLYGGVGLGYLYTINKNTDTNPNPNVNTQQKQTVLDFDYQFTLGVRFMIKNNIGIFAEGGWATTPFQIGLAFKF
jgi:opacity protein-like surface antigen